jgi:hypothetical protein
MLSLLKSENEHLGHTKKNMNKIAPRANTTDPIAVPLAPIASPTPFVQSGEVSTRTDNIIRNSQAFL